MRFPLALVAAPLLALALAGCLGASQFSDGAIDLVLHNGRAWTGDGFAEAVAIDGGRIAFVGSSAQALALAGPGTRVVDARGGSVLPGFRDQHAHLLEEAAEVPAGDTAPFEPSLGQTSVADTEAGRTRVAAYHLATKAAGKTPSDAWRDDAVTDCRPTSPVTEDLKARLRSGMASAASQGLTTVVEPGLADLGIWDALMAMTQEGPLPVRVLVRVAWGCIDEAAERGLATGVGNDWARILGVKLYSDGWLGPRTCALREPFADRPFSDGILFHDPATWVQHVGKAKRLGFNVGTHTIGDRAMEVLLDAYEANGVRAEDRWALEHAQVLAPDLIERAARLGVVLSMQTSFATSDMGFAEAALGEERASWAYAWKSALDGGARLAGGTDFPIDVLNPLWGVQRTATRQELTGAPAGGWFPEQRLTLGQTLGLITRDAAYASLEDDRGVLAQGMGADVVVLQEDLFALPLERVHAATVVLTVANGAITFEGAQAHPA
jgi:predicted amidohydrolase YtcJ